MNYKYTIQSPYCSRFLPTQCFGRNDGRIAKKGVAAGAAAAVRDSTLPVEAGCRRSCRLFRGFLRVIPNGAKRNEESKTLCISITY